MVNTLTDPSRAVQVRINDANTRWRQSQNNEKEIYNYYYCNTLLPQTTTKPNTIVNPDENRKFDRSIN